MVQRDPEWPAARTCEPNLLRRIAELWKAYIRSAKSDSEERSMSADALLLWMSARRQGSWQQFRAAVEELHSA